MEDSALLDEACSDLVSLLKAEGLDIHAVDRVVGPAMGAITLAHELSRRIGVERANPCLRAYTEKGPAPESKQMIFSRTAIQPGERILLAEDVFTTGGSIEQTAQAIRDASGVVLPFVALLVNRSGLAEAGGRKIVALIDRSMPVWSADACPLCKQGSEPIRPKGRENWTRLNAPV